MKFLRPFTRTAAITGAVSACLLIALQSCSEPAQSPHPPLPTPAPVVAEPEQEMDEQTLLNLRINLGSSAKRLCSSVLVSGRSVNDVMNDELNNPALSDVEFVISDAGVTASVTGNSAQAIYRPGIGCTLLVDENADTLMAAFDPARLIQPAAAGDAEWPLGDRVSLPEPDSGSVPGIDLVAVNAAVDQTFQDMQPDQNIRTRAVVIVHRGRIIAERYAEPFDADTPQLGWSMAKTVTAALTGMMEADGLLDISAPAPVPEWQISGDPRGEISHEQLLQMSSGLAFSEVYTAGSMSDVILMLYTTGDTGGFAASQPLAHDPGTHFYYSSGTSNIIARLQRDLFEDWHDYLNYPRQRLFNPLGMRSAVLEPDESGTFVGSSYMYATPRDWARFGLLYLQDGVWNGERLLPEGFVERSVTPAAAPERGQYGYQVWLNAGAPEEIANRVQPSLPETMYYLSGFEGQNILIFPEQDLIVLRMGLTTSGPRPVWELAERVLAAME